MLDIKFIRENPDIVKKAVKDKGFKIDIDEFLGLDKEKRALISKVESLKNEKNKKSEEIGVLMEKRQNAKDLIDEMKTLSQKIASLEVNLEGINKKFSFFIYNIPNIPHSSVPAGPGPESNKVIKEWGKIPRFKFEPRSHIDIATLLNIVDFGRASKMTGAGFVLYKGLGARLERALYNFMLDLHTKKHGYIEIFPPFLVNRKSMTSTGQLPLLEQDMYRLKDDDLFLIPTAEVPVTNIHANEILDEEDLPLYYTAYTACFRREAGSYGKDTKGLIRVHQFDKVELVKFVKPETSYDELEKLLKDAEKVIQLLELPYRISALSTGDLSFAAAKCYDIELWAPGIKKWLEVSSCSNFTDFQARRANIKYRRTTHDARRRPEYVHTLNGSGVALARLVIAILEVHQNQDGSVNIPKALQPFMDGIKCVGRP